MIYVLCQMFSCLFFTPDLKLSFHCYFTHMQNLKIPEFRSRCWWWFNNTLPLLLSFDFRLKLTNSSGNTKDQGRCFTIKLDATNLKDKMKGSWLQCRNCWLLHGRLLVDTKMLHQMHTVCAKQHVSNKCLFDSKKSPSRSVTSETCSRISNVKRFAFGFWVGNQTWTSLLKHSTVTPSDHFPLFPFLYPYPTHLFQLSSPFLSLWTPPLNSESTNHQHFSTNPTAWMATMLRVLQQTPGYVQLEEVPKLSQPSQVTETHPPPRCLGEIH